MTKVSKATAAVASSAAPVVLVTVDHGKPVTTTERVAAAAGLKHASVIKLVRKHRERLEKFGPIRFEIRMGNRGGVPTEYAVLSYEQSTLLFTWLKNTPVVMDVKFRLVEAFFKTTAELAKLKALHADPVWQVARTDSKRGYRFMTRITHDLRVSTDKPATTGTHIAEARVVAYAMTGDGMDLPVRDKLPPDELRLLDHVQFENGILIARGLSRPDRRHVLRGVVLQARADRAIKIGAQA